MLMAIELFCCLEGIANLDTADGCTTTLRPHELAVVPRNTGHRLRVEGRAVVLVIDAITLGD
jgi:mannose-6-phosphate isomerase-like protein (cupin superfamily)